MSVCDIARPRPKWAAWRAQRRAIQTRARADSPVESSSATMLNWGRARDRGKRQWKQQQAIAPIGLVAGASAAWSSRAAAGGQAKTNDNYCAAAAAAESEPSRRYLCG